MTIGLGLYVHAQVYLTLKDDEQSIILIVKSYHTLIKETAQVFVIGLLFDVVLSFIFHYITKNPKKKTTYTPSLPDLRLLLRNQSPK